MKKFLLVASVVTMLLGISVSVLFAAPVRWEVGNGGNGHLYEAILVPAGLTWTEANTAAQAMAGHWNLVTITSAEENAFVFSLVSDKEEFWNCCLSGHSNGPWLGAYLVGPTRYDYAWVNGEPFVYTNWGPREPFGNGNRISFFGYSTLIQPYWNDVPDSYPGLPPLGYIVENPMPFTDVPPGHWAEEAIYKLYNSGITKGCSADPLLYCPDRVVSKASMAVFILRSLHGGSYTPPPATGIFTDVAVNDWFAPWIEQLYREGITKGCSSSPLMYCPDRVVSKASMAVFLLRSIHGANYTPPPATGIFTDVAVNDWFASWIEQLYREGITKGCSTNPLMYCPNRAVSKAAMALFLVRAFGL